MLENRAQYQKLLASGKIRDSKKKEAMIELIVQLDYKLEDLEQTMQEQINNPSYRSKHAISGITPNTIIRNSTISVDHRDSPNLK